MMDKLLAVLVSVGLLLSLMLAIRDRNGDSVGVSVWKFFSYYTTLSNILVCIWILILVFKPSESFVRLASDANISAAITFYILTVGLANYALFGVPDIPLINLIADSLVHAVVPIVTFLFWLLSISHEGLSYSFVPYWLIYPLTYAAYTVLHGNWTAFYPYPFTNIRALGVLRVSVTVLLLSFCVLLGGYLFVTVGKALTFL